MTATAMSAMGAMTADPLGARTAANRRRGLALVAAPAVLLGIAVGLLLWLASSWPFGVIGFAVGTLLLGALMWWAAEPLSRRALGGEPADPLRHARLLNLVDGLCATIGAYPPDVRVRPDSSLNAAVCGRRRRRATLVVTQGLLDQLNRMELEGVVAQQLTRIRCHDMLPATVTVATLGVGASLFSPPEPVTAMDRAAVNFTRYPPGLVSALEKLGARGTEIPGASRATAHLWFAAAYGNAVPFTSLKDRIEALREL